jgi:hypothetical protein
MDAIIDEELIKGGDATLKTDVQRTNTDIDSTKVE